MDDQEPSKPVGDSDQTAAVEETGARSLSDIGQASAAGEVKTEPNGDSDPSTEYEVLEESAQELTSPVPTRQSTDASSLLDFESEMKDPTEPLEPTVVALPVQARVSSSAEVAESSPTSDREMASPAPKAEDALFGSVTAKTRPSPLKLTSESERAEKPAVAECKMEISPSFSSASSLSTELASESKDTEDTTDSEMAALPSPASKTKAEPARFATTTKSRPLSLKLASVAETAEEPTGTEYKMEISPSMPSTSGLSTVKSKRPRGSLPPDEETVGVGSQAPAAKTPRHSTSPGSGSSPSAEAVRALAAAWDRQLPERPCANAEFSYSELADSASSSRTSISAFSEQLTSEIVSSGIFTFDSDTEDPTMDDDANHPSPPILISGPPSESSQAPSEITDSSQSTTTNGCFRPGDPNEARAPPPSPASISGSSSSIISPGMPPSWDPVRRPLIRRPIPIYPSASTSTSDSPDVLPSTSAGVPRSVSFPGARPPGEDLPYAFTLTQREFISKASGNNTTSESGVLLPPPPHRSRHRHPSSFRDPSTSQPMSMPQRLQEAPLEASLQEDSIHLPTTQPVNVSTLEVVPGPSGVPTEKYDTSVPLEQLVRRQISGITSQEGSSALASSASRDRVVASSADSGVCATFNVSGVSESDTRSQVSGSATGREESAPTEGRSLPPIADPEASQNSFAEQHGAGPSLSTPTDVIDVAHRHTGGIERIQQFEGQLIDPERRGEPSVQEPAQLEPSSVSQDDSTGTSETSSGQECTSADRAGSSADRAKPSFDKPGPPGSDSQDDN